MIYGVVEMGEGEVEGIKLGDKCEKIEDDVLSWVNIRMGMGWVVNGEDEKNYGRVKEGVEWVEGKMFEYEDDEMWESMCMIGLGYIGKGC